MRALAGHPRGRRPDASWAQCYLGSFALHGQAPLPALPVIASTHSFGGTRVVQLHHGDQHSKPVARSRPWARTRPLWGELDVRQMVVPDWGRREYSAMHRLRYEIALPRVPLDDDGVGILSRRRLSLQRSCWLSFHPDDHHIRLRRVPAAPRSPGRASSDALVPLGPWMAPRLTPLGWRVLLLASRPLKSSS